MDRSADSIGSCSLDVDADSTDFSDTSGSLNLPTPSSGGKDITREFTSRIKERCQLNQINCQQTTTILDPLSGKISTIITTSSSAASSTTKTPLNNNSSSSNSNSSNIIDTTTLTPITTISTTSSPIKKPSYLNLACCVNGYSNLTTYDSKLRQNINKSREVSPIRPSTNSLQYCKIATCGPTTNSNRNSIYLTPPVVVVPILNNHLSLNKSKEYIMEKQSINNGCSNNGSSGSAKGGGGCIDTTDNCCFITNGGGKYLNKTFSSSSTTKISTITSTSTVEQQYDYKTSAATAAATAATTKSFIQQRVERLYGPGALAQGFYSPKKVRNNIMTSTSPSSILCERTTNNAQQQKTNTKYSTTSQKFDDYNNLNNNNYKMFNNIYQQNNNNNNHIIENYENLKNSTTPTRTTLNNYDSYGGGSGGISSNNDGIIGDHQIDDNDLPVLRHLRPEFRAQLPILSPKRSINIKQQTNHQKIDTTISSTTIDNIKIITNGVSSSSLINQSPIIHNIKIEQENDVILTTPKEYIIPIVLLNKNVAIKNGGDDTSILQNHDNNGEQQHILDDHTNNIADDIIVNNKKIEKEIQTTSSSSSSIIQPNDLVPMTIITETQKPSPADAAAATNTNNTIIDVNKIETIEISPQQPITTTTTTTTTTIVPELADVVTADVPNLRNEKSKVYDKKLVTDDDDEEVIIVKNLLSNQEDGIMANNIEKNNCPEIIITNNYEEIEHDGNYFLKILKTEQNRLLDLAIFGEKELELLLQRDDISEEIYGYLRSASGKARLFVSQKMKQFEGLCNNNLNQLPGEKFPTTNGDLQGFWDMLLLQVDHIDILFKEIEELKANNWKNPIDDVKKPPPPQGSKLIRRPMNGNKKDPITNGSGGTAATAASLKKTTTTKLAAQKREQQRKQLLELKRKNKIAISSSSNDTTIPKLEQKQLSPAIEIYVNDPPPSSSSSSTTTSSTSPNLKTTTTTATSTTTISS